jgi:hypothetical protein
LFWGNKIGISYFWRRFLKGAMDIILGGIFAKLVLNAPSPYFLLNIWEREWINMKKEDEMITL